MLQSMQEFGHPPEELMKKIQEHAGADTAGPDLFSAGGNPFEGLGGAGGMPAELSELFNSLMKGGGESTNEDDKTEQNDNKKEEKPKMNNPFENM